MIIDTTQTKIERNIAHRRAFPIREDVTVLRAKNEHPFTILCSGDLYPSEVGIIFIDDYKITYLDKGLPQER